jgi:hypothetical protein
VQVQIHFVKSAVILRQLNQLGLLQKLVHSLRNLNIVSTLISLLIKAIKYEYIISSIIVYSCFLAFNKS